MKKGGGILDGSMLSCSEAVALWQRGVTRDCLEPRLLQSLSLSLRKRRTSTENNEEDKNKAWQGIDNMDLHHKGILIFFINYDIQK